MDEATAGFAPLDLKVTGDNATLDGASFSSTAVVRMRSSARAQRQVGSTAVLQQQRQKHAFH